MKRLIILSALTTAVYAFYPDADAAQPIDPMGWDEISTAASRHSDLMPYFNPFTESKMYEQRDYFAKSKYGHLTVEVYQFWGDVQVDQTTIGLYKDILSNYNSKIEQMIYNKSPADEYMIFVDASLYQSLIDVLEYHKQHLKSSKFDQFSDKIKIALDELHGKTIAEAREILFDSKDCPTWKIHANYC